MAYTIQEQLTVKRKKIDDYKQKIEILEQEVKDLEKKRKDTEIADFIKSIAEAGFSFDDIRKLIAEQKTISDKPQSQSSPTSDISFSEQKTNESMRNTSE